MFKSVKAKNSQEYFNSLPKDRKEILLHLDKFIGSTAPSLKPNFIYNMPGYGSFKYLNYKKQELDWPIIEETSTSFVDTY